MNTKWLCLIKHGAILQLICARLFTFIHVAQIGGFSTKDRLNKAVSHPFCKSEKHT
jgi:hypothetical protein